MGAVDPAELAHIHPELRHLARPIGSVIKDPANLRKHDARNLAAVKASLAEFGQRDAVKIRKATGQLEAGEGRLLAALELGWKFIAVLECDDDAVTATRYAIADNRSAELATWDEPALGRVLGALDAEGVELEALGSDSDRRLRPGLGGTLTAVLPARGSVQGYRRS